MVRVFVVLICCKKIERPGPQQHKPTKPTHNQTHATQTFMNLLKSATAMLLTLPVLLNDAGDTAPNSPATSHCSLAQSVLLVSSGAVVAVPAIILVTRRRSSGVIAVLSTPPPSAKPSLAPV